MNRQQRRSKPSQGAIRAALKRAGDDCGCCGRPLVHCEATQTGYVRGRLTLVARCCANKLDDGLTYGVGFYFAPDRAPPHMEADRLWFAAHPRRSHRVRPAAPEERNIPTPSGRPVNWVVVRQLRPGVRQRAPIVLPDVLCLPPDTEESCQALFDAVTDTGPGSTVSPGEIAARVVAMARGGEA